VLGSVPNSPSADTVECCAVALKEYLLIRILKSITIDLKMKV
jgi:hypothetical protein